MIENPFVIYGYESDDTFCDRDAETRQLLSNLRNGRNVSLIAPRRIGKSGLIEHLFHQADVAEQYYTFHIDIYATKNISEMVAQMGRSIIEQLMPRGRKLLEQFFSFVKSLKSSLSFDVTGNPSWDISLGEAHSAKVTLDEIFKYLEGASKPCIVAIDEFQTIATYPEGTVEALLRTYIQQCHNSRFIFAGSQRTMMAEMFLSAARPFYQSTTTMSLEPLPLDVYADFVGSLFGRYNKTIDHDCVVEVYRMFNGITWYMQRVMNELFEMTAVGEACNHSMISQAVDHILKLNNYNYESLLFQIPARQKELLIAMAKAGRAEKITSSAFLSKYHLPSASFVQAAVRGLVDKEIITTSLGIYEVYDKFFELWLKRKF